MSYTFYVKTEMKTVKDEHTRQVELEVNRNELEQSLRPESQEWNRKGSEVPE
jgi:hypothetical protein